MLTGPRIRSDQHGERAGPQLEADRHTDRLLRPDELSSTGLFLNFPVGEGPLFSLGLWFPKPRSDHPHGPHSILCPCRGP